MRSSVLVDTSAFQALKNSGNVHEYKLARAVVDQLEAERVVLLTTDYVLDETYTLLRSVLGHSAAVAVGRDIQEGGLEIVQVDESIQKEAWSIFERYADKNFSFTDCTSFVVMRRAKVRLAFTFDRHFQQYGLETLPSQLPVRKP